MRRLQSESSMETEDYGLTAEGKPEITEKSSSKNTFYRKYPAENRILQE